MNRMLPSTAALAWLLVISLTGCMPSRPFYFGDDGDLSHYRALATELEQPDVESDRIGEVENANAPLTLSNGEAREIWDLSLEQAIYTSLANSKIFKTLSGGFPGQIPISPNAGGSTPSRITLGGSSGAATTYEPMLIEADPRFGVEQALSNFDAQLSTSMFWQKNDRPQNFFINGFQLPVFQQDLGTQTTELSKRTASGGQMFVRNHYNYELNNNLSNLFRGAYQADIETEFRHALLQGAGTQFNRIAGPSSISGFYNGVVIARMQVDQSLVQLETNVRNMLSDIEQTYWKLSFCYRDLDAKTTGRDSALQWWRITKERLESGSKRGESFIEARAREQYFFFRNQVEDALSTLYTCENNLRYMMGIAATDGRLIRPSDEPTTAHIAFDWNETQQEMLVRQPELRLQKWQIKTSEMRLIAAKNFLLPRLDAVALYRWRGLGEKLVDGVREDTQIQPTATRASTPSPFNSALQTLTQGDFQEWNIGFQLQMPIGFRKEMAGVRTEQLKLARERAILQEMELEVSHQLSEAIRSLEREHIATRTHYNRVIAVRNEVAALEAVLNAGADVPGADTFDLLLQAMRRRADAESAFYAAVNRYNVAIAGVHFRKGSLLEYNGVQLAEGPWSNKAYFDALKRAHERDAGLMIDYGFTRPNRISSGPYSVNSADPFTLEGLQNRELRPAFDPQMQDTPVYEQPELSAPKSRPSDEVTPLNELSLPSRLSDIRQLPSRPESDGL